MSVMGISAFVVSKGLLLLEYFFQFRENEMLMNHQWATCLERLLLLKTRLNKKKSEESFMYVLKYVSCYITVDVTAYYESVKNRASLF